MKKNYFKKSLSLVLTVLMLMSCWVFVAPTEADAIDAGDAVKATNQALLDGINTNAPDTSASTTYYQYKIYGNGDPGHANNTEANRNEYFKKILSVGTQTVTDINMGSYFTGVPNTDQNVSVVYPSMVLRYDGSGDKPRFGLLFQGDANSGNKMGFQYAKLTTNTSEFTFNPGYWKGIAANDSCFFYIMKGTTEGAYMSAQTTTSGAAFNSRKNGQWEFVATTLEYGGTLSSSEWVKAYKLGWEFHNRSTTFQGTTTSTIYVMNFKAYTDFITQTINNKKAEIYAYAGQYTTESIRNFVNAANNFINYNPKNYTSVTNAPTWGTNIASYASAFNTAASNLKKRNVNVTYENLFSINDWAASASANLQSSSSVEIAVENNNTVKIYKNAAGGEVTTASSYSGNHKDTMYSMPVTGGKDYTVRYNISSSVNGTPASEVFLFWYDSNNRPVNNTAGTNTFNNKGFSDNGLCSVTFTAPSTATKVEIRFDNDCASSGSTLRFSDIAFYPAERNTAVEVDNWTVRPVTKSVTAGSTLSGNLDVPERNGFKFNGWYTDDKNINGMMDSGEEVTDATGYVTRSITVNESINLYADWVPLASDIGYDNIFSLAEWSKTGSVRPSSTSNGSVAYDVKAGTITVESTANGEVYTSYSSDGYTMTVKPDTEYVFSAKMTTPAASTQKYGQMFIFCYDSNGNGVNGPTEIRADGSETTHSSQQHIGIYPTTDGVNTIKFRTPANCTKLRIRVGATAVGVIETYSDIAVFEKAVYDAYAKDYKIVRQEFTVGATDNLNLIPERAGYAFDCWVDANGNKITSVAGLKNSAIVYAKWIQLFKVTFKNEAGDVVKSVEVGPNETVTAPSASTKAPTSENEFKFAGWVDANGNKFTADTVFTGDVTYTATFDAVAHTNVTYIEYDVPTCTTPGTFTRYCECGYEWNDPIEDATRAPAEGHSYERANPSYKVVANSSTGDRDTDSHKIRCNDCTATTTQVHNFQVDTSHPASTATCTIPGETYYLCACHQSKTVKGDVDLSNHVNTSIVGKKDPTCTENGYTGDEVCDACGVTVKSGEVESKKGHSWSATDKFLKSAADCNNAAVYYEECLTCGISAENDTTGTGKTYSKGDALGHLFTKYVDQGDATCDTEGNEIAVCDRCGDATDSRSTGKKREHNFNTKPAVTNNNNGTHTYTYECAYEDCTATTTTDGNCTYGDWTKDNAATHSHSCTVCGYTPAAEAHDWSAWTTVGGSATEKATQTRSCTVCGREETTACKYEAVVHNVATCEAAELTRYECSDCKHGYTVIGEGAKGHNFTQEAGVKNNGEGKHSFACANGCGEYGFETTKNMIVPCSEWTYANTEAGKHTATCKVCAYVKTEDCSGGNASCITLATCEKCNTAYGDYAAHVVTGTEKYLKKATDATCIANETYYKYCIVCENEFSATETYEKPDTMTAHDYTCTAEYLYIATQAKCDVNETYYAYCSNPDCKKSSEDANNTYEKVGTALAHKFDGAIKCNDNGTHTIACSQSNTDGWVCDETADYNCADTAELIGVVPAECLTDGYTMYQCKLCDYEWDVAGETALGHEYTVVDKANVKEAANCEHGTIYWYACKWCDANGSDEQDTDKYTTLFVEDTDKRAHEFQNKVDGKYLAEPATCFAAAKYYSSCKYDDCGKSSEAVNGEGKGVKFSNGTPLAHDWKEVEDAKYLATKPDCVNDATYYYECSLCKNSSKDYGNGSTWTDKDSKIGHTLEYTAAKAATCDAKGNYEYWYCSVCKKYFKDSQGNDAYLGLSATEISKRDHDMKDVGYVPATCEADGCPAYKYCAYEDCTYTTRPEVIPEGYKATGHNFVGGYTYDAVLGYHSKLCANGCGKSGLGTEEYTVEYDGLDYIIKNGEKCVFTYTATTKDGEHTHALTCVCGNNTSKTYSYDETFVETIVPTCTTGGYDSFKCPDCDHTWKMNEVGSNGHTPADKATSNGNGTHSIYCTVENCGYKISTDKCSGGTATCSSKAICEVCKTAYGEATGDHVLADDAWTVESPATCTDAEVLTQICSDCNLPQTKTGAAALGHDMSDYTYEVPAEKAAAAAAVVLPTCAKYGVKVSYCKVCDHYLSYQTMEKGEHEVDFENDPYTEVGNCATGVTYVYTCKCGTKISKPGKTGHKYDIAVKSYGTCNAYGYIVLACTQCGLNSTIDETTAGFGGTVTFEGYGDINTADLLMKEHDTTGSELVVTKAPTCSAKGRGYRACVLCQTSVQEDIEELKNAHNIESDENTLRLIKGYDPTCTSAGRKDYYECKVCGYSQNADNSCYIAALGHIDTNADSSCDRCGSAYNEVSSTCGCICHKESGFMKFIYKILKFFWKLFGMNKECPCGLTHY